MNAKQPATGGSYVEKARQRARRRALEAKPEPAVTPAEPYRRHRPNRYKALAASPSVAKPASSPPGPIVNDAPSSSKERVSRHPRAHHRNARRPREEVAETEAIPVSLHDEFQRVRNVQDKAKSSSRFQLKRPKRPVLTAVLSVFTVVMIVAGIVLGPVIYRGTRAYQNIFQDRVPHEEAPFVAVVNPEGTSVIVQSTATTTSSDNSIPEWDGKERLTVLLLGVDRREDEVSRSDTMILVNIDPVTKSASMMAIPRDMKVVIPGHGVQKINSAYAFGEADEVEGGGPGLAVNTIEVNFGITVNYYAEVDFQGFVKIIDTVGGLTLDVPYPIKDDEYPGPGNQYMRIYFEPGWQHMDGERALQYARTRHDDGDGRRSERQQQVLLAIRQQAVTLDLLPKAAELLSDFGNAVRTDLGPSQALQLARLASEIDPDAIVRYSLDDALTEEQLPDQPYYLVADWEEVGQIMSQFTGQDIVPPMAALTNPNYQIEIQIEDGTFNPGLGARVAAVLETNGFHNVTVTDKPDLGNYPVSSITTDANNLRTAYLIAVVLGIDLSAINVSDALLPETTPEIESGVETTPTPTPTPSPTEDVGPHVHDAVASPGATVVGVALFPTPTAEAGSTPEVTTAPAKLVIVIGDDAPDPQYFTNDPYSEETSDEYVPADETTGDTGTTDESTDGSE